MINIALCDDEATITEQVNEVLNQYQMERNAEISWDIYPDGESLVKSGKSYDIIFMDIYMKGINGIETAKKIRVKDKMVEIIYLTSYAGLTREALSVHAFDYLEKPVKSKEIYTKLDEVLEKILHKQMQEEIKKKTVVFNSGKNTLRLVVDDIYYFERAERKIIAVTKKGNFNIYETIVALEEKLRQYDFVTPHQSFVVNLNNVKDYVREEVVMLNHDVIPIAQKRASEFKRIMREFLQNKLESK